MKFGPNLLF